MNESAFLAKWLNAIPKEQREDFARELTVLVRRERLMAERIATDYPRGEGG